MTRRCGAGERGDIVLGWLAQLALVLGVTGLLAVDAVALAQSRVQATDHARTAAEAAQQAYASSHNLQTAFDAAWATLPPADTIETGTFTATPDGAVSLRLHHPANLPLLDLVPAVRRWSAAVGSATARPTP